MNSNYDANILQQLQRLRFNHSEARLYLELLKEPSTHLQLARKTGINRSKVYRLIDDLEKHGIVSVQNNDQGKALVASDPEVLEVEILRAEKEIETNRKLLSSLLPNLNAIKHGPTDGFAVKNYPKEEGFKQMLWHELKSKGELLMLGRGNLRDLIHDELWVAQHQPRLVETDYRIRKLVNPHEDDRVFTVNTPRFKYKVIPKNVLNLETQCCIFNDIVSLYYWRQSEKTGIEIINKDYANMMRQMFEHYWAIAKEAPNPGQL